MAYLWWDRIELYNLAEDPMERTSLADSPRKDAHRALGRLGLKLKEWEEHVSRPLASRDGSMNEELPPELVHRLEALGYMQ